MKKIIFTVALATLLMSCSELMYNPNSSNPYYYGMNRIEKQKFKKTTTLKSIDYTDENLKYLLSEGYILVGYCAYRDRFIGIQEAVNAGCAVGATFMLYKHTYVGTASGTAVLPWYTPGEIYTVNSSTSGTVNAYGSSNFSAYGSNGYAYGSSNGSARANYNSSTTTTIRGQGSFSYYAVPYSHDYYDQYAVYLVKKYYYYRTPRDYYSKPDAKTKIGKLNANQRFEVISFCGHKDFMPIKIGNNTYYLDCYDNGAIQ